MLKKIQITDLLENFRNKNYLMPYKISKRTGLFELLFDNFSIFQVLKLKYLSLFLTPHAL